MATATFHRVPVDQLYVDDRYQRELDTGRVDRIVKQFDERRLGALEVSQRNGKGSYAVFDGQHRLEASKVIGLRTVPCLIHKKLSPEQEAELFVKAQKDRKTVHPVDVFRARVFQGDSRAVEIDRIVTEAGYRIAQTGGKTKGTARVINTPKAIDTVYGLGVLPETIALLEELWGGDDGSTAAPVLQGLGIVVKGYGHRIGDEQKARLRRVSPVTIARRAAASPTGTVGGSNQRAARAAKEIRRLAGLRGNPTGYKAKTAKGQ